jgi:hypothetical protein
MRFDPRSREQDLELEAAPLGRPRTGGLGSIPQFHCRPPGCPAPFFAGGPQGLLVTRESERNRIVRAEDPGPRNWLVSSTSYPVQCVDLIYASIEYSLFLLIIVLKFVA